MTHRKYPKGRRVDLTPAWQGKVLAILEGNRITGTPPRSQRELARMIGANPPGVLRALRPDQHGSKYVLPICELLGIDEPKQDSSTVKDDEWSALVAEMRTATPEQQRLALDMLRVIIGRLDKPT